MIDRPSDRYGRERLSSRSRRRVVVVLSAVVVAAAVALAFVAFQRLGTAEVKGELGGYELLDRETIRVTISVTRDDPSQRVVCIIRARSIDGAETGRREVLVPPSSQTTVQVDAVVKSSRPSVVGDVYGCGTDVPAYLVAP